MHHNNSRAFTPEDQRGHALYGSVACEAPTQLDISSLSNPDPNQVEKHEHGNSHEYHE